VSGQEILLLVTYVVLALLLFFIVIYGLLWLLSWRIFHGIFDRPFPRPIYDRSPQTINQETIFGRGQNWFYSNRMDFQDVQMTSYDGIKLSAYYRAADRATNKKLVVILHGWRDAPSAVAAYAQLYLEKTDCHILMLHLRAHGMSQGDYIGYGLADSQDLIMWITYMNKILKGPLEILIHGWSMGAATAILAAGSKRLPENVVGVVADSSFDTLANQIRYIMRKRYHLAPRFQKKMVDHFVIKKLGYSIFMVSPYAKAKMITVPLLLIHGTEDTFVPPPMGEAIYSRVRAPKRFLLIEGAKHVMSYDTAPSIYSSEVEHFLKVCKFLE